MPPDCTLLDWDSQFFERRIGNWGCGRLVAPDLVPLTRHCVEQQIDCLYLLADPSDQETARLAPRLGFRLVDVRLTLKVDSATPTRPPVPLGISLRQAEPGDVPTLEAIAAVSHRDSRFYADGRFPIERVDELYRTWIRKSCQDFADAVLVVEEEKGGRAVGYITCKIDEQRTGQIGLVGVAGSAQGRGCGLALIDGALGWFRTRGVERITVVTQGRNIRAQRLYQRMGFRSSSIGLWYHRWTDEDPG